MVRKIGQLHLFWPDKNLAIDFANSDSDQKRCNSCRNTDASAKSCLAHLQSSMKNETFEKQLDQLTKDFELMNVKNGELKDDLTKLKTQTTSTTENIKTEVKQLAVS